MTPDEPAHDVGWQVPDDARDLQRDVEALHRERRAARRRARLRRLMFTRRWDRYGLSGPLVVAILLVVGVFGGMMTLLRPSFPAESGAEPLARPTVPPGSLGGLLPEGPVTTPAGRTTTRALTRPGVLVLVPAPCDDCTAAVRSVVDQVRQATRHVRLVSTGAQDRDGRTVARLQREAGRGIPTVGVDERGVLARAYDRTPGAGVTAVFVNPDGVVADIVRDIGEDQRLDSAVGKLTARTHP